ncbi:MAG: alpha/beta hydrolase family protein [Edafosvirus sp.]|uniref:Alpha/beta hydrolase family protein n=1 Tax=Edafosvirus sp. TaxID=2487765 RepID=A0A3G4ZTL0_9VIRU|nr:MAG: alpha/beta hydrolase family protein [Edafosvirus sp.]
MGTSSSDLSSGLDSIGSVDDTINKIIFCAPDTDKKLFVTLNDKSTKLLYAPSSGIMTSTIIITPVNKKNDKWVIFSHGNGCDIYTFYSYLKQFSDTFGVTVVCYDYPGYGLTEGKATEETCYQSLVGVVAHVSTLINPSNIILIGQSLGTGVVINYISKHPWMNPTVLISPYKNIPAVAIDTSCVTSLTKNYKFHSHAKMEDIKCPVKIFHGDVDEFINISHAKELYSKLPNKSLLPIWIPGAGHNDILYQIAHKDILEVINYKIPSKI